MEGAKSVPPHLRGKAIPPHLRNKQKQAEAKAVTIPEEHTITKPQTPVPSKTLAVPLVPATPPPVAITSPTASGLAASRHAPPAIKIALRTSSSPVNNIAQKLTSVGAKVSEAKPVPKPALVTYASSDEGEGNSTKSGSASSKAMKKQTTNATSRPTVQTSFANVRATSPEEASKSQGRSRASSSAQQAQRGVHAQRGQAMQRGRGRGGRAPREARWPKNSEIPKGDPERWEIKWENTKDVGSNDSARADSGWGSSEKKAETPNGIDPDTGFLLTDYAGQMAPPPVDWDARPAFRPQQCADTIDKWRQRIEVEMLGKNWAVPQIDVVAADGNTYYFAPNPRDADMLIQGDIAPHYWSPIVVGQESPSTFWRKLLASDEPEPMDEGDLVGAKPWWELYEAGDSCALMPCEHPEGKGISPSETQHERLRRENDNGSLFHAENRRKAEIAKNDALREKRKRAQEKSRKLSAGQPTGSAREIKAGLKLYLRSACPEDMPRIKEIYNHYVEHTVCVPETERRKDADMLQRYHDIRSKKLPFLVACERGTQMKSRKNKEPITLPEKLVGFAYADDYHDLKGMYRFTADIEVYTDTAQYMKGVGKCLSDKLLGLLDPDYVERGGYDIEGEELEGVGPSRVISNIIATVPYDREERLAWKSRFLNDFLGFEQVGLMRNTGNKLGQSVSVAIFQRSTGVTFDSANPPIMCEYTK